MMMWYRPVGLSVIAVTICLWWRLMGGGGYGDFLRAQDPYCSQVLKVQMWQVKSSTSSIAWVISGCKIKGGHIAGEPICHTCHTAPIRRRLQSRGQQLAPYDIPCRHPLLWQLRVVELLCPFAGCPCLSPRLQPFSLLVLFSFFLITCKDPVPC